MAIPETRFKAHKSVASLFTWLVALLVLAGCAKYKTLEDKLRFAFPEYAKCDALRVIDGSRFYCQLSNKEIEKVSLIGVEIPETIAEDAAKFTASKLLRGTPVKLEFDEETRYGHGSISAYVYLPGGKMLNALLLEYGYAKAATDIPNMKFKDLFLKVEAEAREQGKGLWRKN